MDIRGNEKKETLPNTAASELWPVTFIVVVEVQVIVVAVVLGERRTA